MSPTATIPLLILAGGRATRLGALSENLPKYLMPVKQGETFADQHLLWAKEQGFKEVFLSIGYLGSMIREYCGTGQRWNLQIKYIEDGPAPLGTGGAVQASLKYPYQNICITYGDTLLNFNVSNFIENFLTFKNTASSTYQASTYQASMCIYENKVPGHTCNIDWRPPHLIYNKNHPQPNWKHIDYGFLIMNRTFVESFQKFSSTENVLAKEAFDLAAPLSEASYQNQILGYLATERFWEIGAPEALEEFQKRTSYSSKKIIENT